MTDIDTTQNAEAITTSGATLVTEGVNRPLVVSSWETDLSHWFIDDPQRIKTISSWESDLSYWTTRT